MSNRQLPTRLAIAAGTYDGVLAGWDTVKSSKKSVNGNNQQDGKEDLLTMLNKASPQDKNAYLKMNFAMAVHDGSVRCLSMASAQNDQSQKRKKTNGNDDDEEDEDHNRHHPIVPGTLLSAGYDESIAMFSLTKLAQSGELKTPSNMGTPTCSAFAPPSDPSPSHVLMGLSSGKIVIYKRSDMSIQHVLPGHDDKGVSCIAVHPSGKMALSGGRDGKICLWDLMRGRLAFVSKIPNPRKGRKATVNHIVWSEDGARFAYCTHEGNITAREMETGQDLLDINMPSNGRANQICFVGGDDGLFLAAACNDGGLPVFAVGSIDEEDEEAGTRRAIMAIEPVEGVATAGDERFKCINTVDGGSGFLVVTANSGGIISLIDLEGAAQMMLSDDAEQSEGGDEENDKGSDDDEESDDEDDEEVAAEILESVRIGTGARITCISTWSYNEQISDEDLDEEGGGDEEMEQVEEAQASDESEPEDMPYSKKRKTKEKEIVPEKKENEIELDKESLEKARALVSQAKKRQKKKKAKKRKRDNDSN